MLLSVVTAALCINKSAYNNNLLSVSSTCLRRREVRARRWMKSIKNSKG